MSNDSHDFFGGGFPSAKFPAYGSKVEGVVTEEPQVSQQTTPEGKLKTWDDGNPMLQLVVTLQTDENDPEIDEDDGQRRLYVKGQMRNAIQSALKATGSKGLDVGGKLAVVYTHDGERTNPAFSPPKQYAATYAPPQSDGGAGFLGTAVSGGGGGGNGNGRGAVTTSAAAVPENLPPGMTPEIWASLGPEAQAALRNIAAK